MPSKALYNERKQNHLCTRCGKRDGHTESGHTLCYECAEKGSIWQKEHYDRETNTIRTRWYISKRIAQGKCIRCASAASPGTLCARNTLKWQGWNMSNGKERRKRMLPCDCWDCEYAKHNEKGFLICRKAERVCEHRAYERPAWCPLDKAKCGNGIKVVTREGIEIDPHCYEEIETHENCTVHVLKCKECGHIEIEWEKNDD